MATTKKTVTKKSSVTTTDEKVATVVAPTPVAPVIKKLERIDPNEIIDVQSCTYGELIYVSKKNGYTILWDDFGCVNPVTVGDLIDMRNGQKKFFEEPWIVLTGDRAPIIMEYLQIAKYYNNFNKIEDFDEIFSYEPDELKSVVSSMSDSMKEVVARRAYALVHEGSLDSNKLIVAIEESTGYKIQD